MTARIEHPGDRLRLAAIAILIAGGQSFAIGSGDSSRELQQLERLGGKAAVQTFKFQRWFSLIWPGQQLAYTLAVLGAAVAPRCWRLASLMGEPHSR